MKGLTDPMVGLLMGQTAENLAFRFGITRREMDEFSARSHQRVLAAQKAGRFDGEIVPLFDPTASSTPGTTACARIRRRRISPSSSRSSTASTATSPPATARRSPTAPRGWCWHRSPPWRDTSSPVLGTIVDSEWAGLDPAQMGLGPVHAATPLLQRHGLQLGDLDAWEINEAFAAQVLACLRAWADEAYCRSELGLERALGTLDEAKLNVDGGAIALGHPVGASGARIVLHVLNVLKRGNGRRGIAAICIGGGLGGAMLVERA